MQMQDSLIRVETSPIARFNSLLRRKNFSVRMRRELARKRLFLMPFLRSLIVTVNVSPSSSQRAAYATSSPSGSARRASPFLESA